MDLEIYGVHCDGNYSRTPKYRDLLISDLRDLSRILQFAEKIRPDAVISDQCDYSMIAQALISEKMGLPGPKVKQGLYASNKYLQRCRGKEKNILVPEFALCLSTNDVRNFVSKHGYPAIIKPADNRGSFGINKIVTENCIEEAFYDALKNSISRLVLVEKFIEGTHLTVDGYCFSDSGPKALAVASKVKLRQKNSIIDGEITYPAQISPTAYTKAAEVFEFTSKSYGFDFGHLHGEFILAENEEIYLTEIANRGGGVFTSELIVPNVSGINLNKQYIDDVLGIKTKFGSAKIEKNHTLLKFFSFSETRQGFIKKINGFNEALADENILALKMLIKKGDYIGDIRSGADRHGLIILKGRTLDVIKASLNRAVNLLEVEFEKR
jgi:biotin carboxylase